MARRVMVIDMTGKYLRSYESLMECAKAEGITYSTASKVLREGILCDTTLHFYDYEIQGVDYSGKTDVKLIIPDEDFSVGRRAK